MPTYEETISAVHIEELTRQRDALKLKVDALSELVREFPAKLTGARLDAREGKQTYYDYSRAGNALNMRES